MAVYELPNHAKLPMKMPFTRTFYFIGTLFLAIFILLTSLIIKSKMVANERIKDVEALTQICLESTNNISNTQELLVKAERQNIRLYSPIPKIPGQPCYRLVEPYFVQTSDSKRALNDILIEETNVTDRFHIYMSTIDGSVFARPLNQNK